MKPKSKHEDISQVAFRVVQQATNEQKPFKSDIKAAMSFMGRMGGLKGGKARAASLSSQRRKEIAQKAAQTRWKKEKK